MLHSNHLSLYFQIFMKNFVLNFLVAAICYTHFNVCNLLPHTIIKSWYRTQTWRWLETWRPSSPIWDLKFIFANIPHFCTPVRRCNWPHPRPSSAATHGLPTTNSSRFRSLVDAKSYSCAASTQRVVSSTGSSRLVCQVVSLTRFSMLFPYGRQMSVRLGRDGSLSEPHTPLPSQLLSE
jgi:hypothetical protein